MDPEVKEAITKYFDNHPCASSITHFVETHKDLIVKYTPFGEPIQDVWVRWMKDVAKEQNIKLAKRRTTPNWGAMALELWEHHSTAATSTPPSTSKSSATNLKVLLSSQDKRALRECLDGLDPNTFWAINCRGEADQGQNATVVDRMVIDHALRCNYHHPSQSLILDLGDQNWSIVFSNKQLDSIESSGDPLFPALPVELDLILKDVEKLKTPLEAFEYARSLQFDPIQEPLKAWITSELIKTSQLFFHSDAVDIENMMQSDLLYEVWGFLKTMARGSQIKAEGCQQSKKKHHVDVIYSSNDTEIGCVEIDKGDDQTKEMKDGLLKMPLVMHDILLQMARTEAALRNVHVVGFVIIGAKITMLDMDSPGGYIARIRRTEPLEFPKASGQYISHIVPMLRLALSALIIMKKTKAIVDGTRITLASSRTQKRWMPPPTFIPTEPHNPSSSTPSTSSTPSSSRSKKQKKA